MKSERNEKVGEIFVTYVTNQGLISNLLWVYTNEYEKDQELNRKMGKG